MIQKIHINDQGELLLIDALEKPERLILHDHHFEFTPSYRKKWIAYDQALTSAIEKGIKFRDQEVVWNILWENTSTAHSVAHAWRNSVKGQSFDLPNSYTAQVVDQAKTKKARFSGDDWFDAKGIDYTYSPDYETRKVAVLTPLKQARSHSSETIKKVLDSITPEEQAETERKMLSGEPGNEAKKEEQLFTKEDLRTAYEAGLSKIDFEDWFIQKFD